MEERGYDMQSLPATMKKLEEDFKKRRRISQQLLVLAGEAPEGITARPGAPAPPAVAAEATVAAASAKAKRADAEAKGDKAGSGSGSGTGSSSSSGSSSGSSSSSGASGSAPPRNDYAQHYVNTGERAADQVLAAGVAERFDEQPKLKQLLQLKRALLERRRAPALSLRCDLRSFELGSLGTRFDAILIDPPWEEYVRRCAALPDPHERAFWSPEDMLNLRIGDVAAPQSFVWLWVGAAEGLDLGRAMLRKWGYRRCEDICWVKTQPAPAAAAAHAAPLSDHGAVRGRLLHDHDRAAPFVHTKEHCLMGIRGTVRRAQDSHLIHANIDTDVLLAAEPAGPTVHCTRKPAELYQLIERFSQGARRLELFGCDHNVRPGWLTLGLGLSVSNYNAAEYARLHADSHLVGTTDDIEALRPRSPTRAAPPKP